MSPDHRVRFEQVPFTLRLPGQDAVEFVPRPAPLEPAEIERRRLEAELAAARAEIEASREADTELRARLDASIAELVRVAGSLKRELDAEIDAARPALASLALSIAERALVRGLADDPLLLLPAAERAVERVKSGFDEALVVELRVPTATAHAFEVAVLGRQDGALRIVADPSFRDGMVEARVDVRRVRHSVHSVISDVRRTLDPAEAASPALEPRAESKPAAANMAAPAPASAPNPLPAAAAPSVPPKGNPAPASPPSAAANPTAPNPPRAVGPATRPPGQAVPAANATRPSPSAPTPTPTPALGAKHD